MKLKMAVAGASLAGGVGLALIGLNPVVANGAPCGGPQGAQCGGPGPVGPPEAARSAEGFRGARPRFWARA